LWKRPYDYHRILLARLSLMCGKGEYIYLMFFEACILEAFRTHEPEEEEAAGKGNFAAPLFARSPVL